LCSSGRWHPSKRIQADGDNIMGSLRIFLLQQFLKEFKHPDKVIYGPGHRKILCHTFL